MMLPESRRRHTIDVVFLLTLFLVFTISAFMLVTLGAGIYRKTVNHMENNYELRTSFSYVTEKLRQADRAGAVQIGSFDGQPALMLSQTINDDVYITYLYEDNGYLKELFAKSGNSLSREAGQNILPIQAISLELISDSLYRFTLTEKNGTITMLYLHTYCQKEPL